MSDKKPFLEVAFKGRRFQHYLLPLDLLRDLTALNDVFSHLVRDCFLSNSDRERLPSGVFKGSVLCLAGIRDGSVVIDVELDNSDLFSQEESIFFDARGKFFSVIRDVENGRVPAMSPQSLGQFGPLGKGLRDDEVIEFSAEGELPVRYTPSVRKALVQASGQRYTENVFLRGEIVECNKPRHRAEVQTPGGKIPFKFTESTEIENLIDSLSTYPAHPTKSQLLRKKNLLLLEGEVSYGGNRPVYIIRSAEKISPLDPVYRMEELAQLKDNWDGEGTASPSKEGIEWLTDFFLRYPGTLRPPYLCPWEDNTIHAEWRQDGHPLSLNIDIGLDSRVADGVLHYLDNSHPPTDVRYDLNDEKDVRRLYETVKEYGDSFLDE